MHVHARGSGLLVAEQAAAPREIAEQLRRLDRRLELRQKVDHRHKAFVWEVYVAQQDRPSVWLFSWRENPDDAGSRPRPLSSAIVDEAASRSLNSRRPVIDPLAENDRLRERQEQDELADAETAAAEAARRHGRLPAFHPSRALYLARCKARARGERV